MRRCSQSYDIKSMVSMMVLSISPSPNIGDIGSVFGFPFKFLFCFLFLFFCLDLLDFWAAILSQDSVGDDVGLLVVGWNVGLDVGNFVGLLVGLNVGCRVGTLVGVDVGDLDGLSVGDKVGGANVGASSANMTMDILLSVISLYLLHEYVAELIKKVQIAENYAYTTQPC